MENKLTSPYVGQEIRRIKALSQNDVEGLLKGTGRTFGGMAKVAELNSYPGPIHVLDADEAGQLELTSEQKQKTKDVYDVMHNNSVKLGKQLIDIEQEVDAAFKNETITEQFLQEKITESAKNYGELRFGHLRAHLSMVDILTPKQIKRYDKLRGYTS